MLQKGPQRPVQPSKCYRKLFYSPKWAKNRPKIPWKDLLLARIRLKMLQKAPNYAFCGQFHAHFADRPTDSVRFGHPEERRPTPIDSFQALFILFSWGS